MPIIPKVIFWQIPNLIFRVNASNVNVQCLNNEIYGAITFFFTWLHVFYTTQRVKINIIRALIKYATIILKYAINIFKRLVDFTAVYLNVANPIKTYF